MHETCYTFGRRQFLAARRLLLSDGLQRELEPHLSLLLQALLERSGGIVSHEELARKLWPGAIAPGVKLNAQVEDLIEAVFEGEHGSSTIRVDDAGAWISGTITRDLVVFEEEATGATSQSNLPPLRTRLIGRSALVAEAVAQMQSSRLVTLVGPGGVGKTSVALTAATGWERVAGRGAVFVDLAQISDPALLWTTMLGALATVPQGHPRETVISQFQSHPTLVVFDNCEHIVDEVAEAAGELLERCRSIRILATSREALRLPAEVVLTVLPLAVPAEGEMIDEQTMAATASVEMFFERLTQRTPGYALRPDDMVAAGHLCRRLDGMPLSIEFAAARVRAEGVRQVLDQLERRFDLLTDDNRASGDRHAGLLTVLDWSYGLLTRSEQKLLRGVAVFPSDFSAEDVLAASACDGPPGIVHAALRSLLAKSMLVAGHQGDDRRYRLLESTREYALSKLTEAAEETLSFDRFASYVLARLKTADHTNPGSTLDLWNAQRSNAAAAIDWTLRGGGQKSVGIDIVAAALPTWLLLSEISRYSETLERAIEAVSEVMPERRELALQFAFSRSVSLYFALGPNAPGIASGKNAYALAVDLGDKKKLLDTAWNLHAQSSHLGAYEDALIYARRFLRVAQAVGDAGITNQGWRLIAWGYDGLGQHRRGERVFRSIVEPGTWANAKPDTAWAPDAKVIRSCMQSRFHWFAGRSADALMAIEEAVRHGQSEERAHTFCTMLAHIIVPTAIWSGNLDLAVTYTTILSERARRNFDNFSKWADMLSAAIDVCGGSRAPSALSEKIASSWPFRQEVFATLHPELASEHLLSSPGLPANSWSRPELLRILGNRALSDGDRSLARALFEEGLALARSRGSVPFGNALQNAIQGLA